MAWHSLPPPPPGLPQSSSPSSLVRVGILVLPPPFLLLLLLLFFLVSTSSTLMASSSFATMPIDRDRSRNRWREMNTVARPRLIVTNTTTTSSPPLPPESPPKGEVFDRWQSERVKDISAEKNEGKWKQESQVKNTMNEGKCQRESQVRKTTTPAPPPTTPDSPPKVKVLERWKSDRVKDIATEKNEVKWKQEYQVKNKTNEGKCQRESQVKDIAAEKDEGKFQQEFHVRKPMTPAPPPPIPKSPPKGKVLDRWKSTDRTKDIAAEKNEAKFRQESQVKHTTTEGKCQQESQVKDIAAEKDEGKCQQESQVKDIAAEKDEGKCQQESQVKDVAAEKDEGKCCQESLVITKMGGDGDSSCGGSGKVGDLIQKWRELEAEAAVSPTNRSGNHQSVFSPTSESSDDTGWESDLTMESEKEHVQGGVGKRDEVGIVGQESLIRRRSGEKVFAGMFDGCHLRIRGREQIQNLIRKFEGERKREVEWLGERRAVSGFVHRKKIQNFLRYKSLQKHMAIQNLRPESTAQELDQLHHGIAIVFLRQQFSPGPQKTCTPLLAVENETQFHTTFPNNKLDPVSFEMRQELGPDQERSHTYLPTVEKKTASYKQSSIDYLNSVNYEFRQRFSPQRQEQGCESLSTSDKKSIFHLSLSSNCSESNIHQRKQPCSLAPLPSTEYQEEAVERDLDDIIQADEESLASGSEDLQEDSQHPDLAWEEASLQTRNIDWGRPSSSVLHSAQDGIETKNSHMDNHQEMGESDGTWLYSAHASELQSGSGAAYTDLLETYSDNSELRDLLERRTVSTSLSSDFREKLDKVILSSLQRRRMVEENFIEEDQDEFVQNYDDGFHADDRAESSLSLLPLSSQMRAQPHHHECTPRDRHLIQMDVVLDMRTDIANIHTEMSELRKLLASCMERNSLPYSVQQDVTTVVRHSVSMGNSSFSSQWEPASKGSCCICYEKQVDSLLYRCGHMCTCFKCATELQWNSGRCPVCRSPIVDVVRAYTYS